MALYRVVACYITDAVFNRNVWQKPMGFVLCCIQNVVKFILTLLLPLLWWCGYRPVRNLWLLKLCKLKLDGGFCEGTFLARQLWVTAYMMNDTFIWNTATIWYGLKVWCVLIGVLITVYNILYDVLEHNYCICEI